MTNAEWILKVVDSFYLKAKTDILIGYHFRVIPDFDEHIPRIASFWDLQLLGKTERKMSSPFDVMKLHQALGIKRGELGRWLVLFRKTLDEETNAQPEMQSLKDSWEEKLVQFEGIFLRFLGL
jgi:truncated hemoglobin YjbI